MTMKQSAVRVARKTPGLGSLINRWQTTHSWTQPSASQHGEDMILRAVLPEADGTYVDIGANHPVYFSNTWSLYRRGWSGILIDPLEEAEMLCRAQRPRDRFLKLAIGPSAGSATLFTFDYDVCSTMSERMAEAATSFGMRRKDQYEVSVVPLSSLGFSATPDEPCLLDVDVEDLDLEVIESNDFSTFLPRVILVEERRHPIEAATPISEKLGAEGYVLIAVTIFNSIYVHRQWLENNERFRGYFPADD